ncbi:DUF6542 domain-containing protein [Actinomycetospora sp. TBRC 11914]|uniref:DUF6542 domain-containing protein n=1 Tax=Actinomycetospora sp. TBRC 11914 TaxID=2729387 RepID=UPI00145EEF89|nr:DUF6542 domain-containing protein [Actinomycetospora sp. TBRC 11914]NMO88862.1 hypothetical protein [Actinomycetospora sp. TBRC 11914]
MTTTRDDAPSSASPEVGEASSFPGVRGMRWWAVVLLALVLTAGGVAADVVRAGSLGGIFLAAYPAGCALAALLVQRRDLFVAMVQPPLLLAVSVPVAVAATGSLPASGGLASTALAVGAPLINGFPAMAITTVVCVVIGVVRIRTQRWRRDDAVPRQEPVRSGPAGGAARDRGGSRDGRRPAAEDRRREPSRNDRDPAERDRRRPPERARTERERPPSERDRGERERRDRERAERDRGRRDAPRPEPTPEGRPAAQRSAPPPERPSAPPPERPAERGAPPPTAKRPAPPAAGAREPRSREDRMREERLREERRNGPPQPPGVHPVRDRRPDAR